MDYDKFSKSVAEKQILVGFDGFVDTIVDVVSERDGSKYKRIETITEFGERVISAAGKSSNIETVVKNRVIGGNAPLLANALTKFGAKVKFIGALGDCENNIFCEFAKRTSAVSVGEYGKTRALEFSDGKILLGEMEQMQKVGVDSILSKISKDELIEIVSSVDAFAFANWTMLPHMTEIAQFFLDEIFPNCQRSEKMFFFDLADPEKRKKSDLLKFLKKISFFEKYGKLVLGLNLREAQQVLSVLGKSADVFDGEESLKSAAKLIQDDLDIDLVFIHGIKNFAAANRSLSSSVTGYYVSEPKILTGAGDHYNAGFLAAYLCFNDVELSLHFASAVCAFFVKNAISATIENIEELQK